MNDHASWMQANETYLAAALAWLRLRLEKMAGPGEKPVEPAKKKRGGFCARLFGKPSAKPAESPDTSRDSRDDAIAKAAQTMTKAESNEPPPALIILAQRLGLSHFEQQVLLLCAALELDTRIPSLCARAQNDPHKPYPTFALALALFDDPVWDALSPQNPLRYWRLIEINQPGATPLTASALRADERIVNYLKGLNYLDDRLAPLARTAFPGRLLTAEELPPSQDRQAVELLNRLRVSGNPGRTPVIAVAGHGCRKQASVARLVAAGLGLPPLPPRRPNCCPANGPNLTRLPGSWQRECCLLPLALYVDAAEADGPDAHETQACSHRSGSWGVPKASFSSTWTIPIAGGAGSTSLVIQKPTPRRATIGLVAAPWVHAEDSGGHAWRPSST